MPNQIATQKLAKGDVIWVPYRMDPLWPALVNNVYPKRVSYSFFPLTEEDVKRSRFSCATKLTYAFVVTEPLPNNANADLKKAHLAACEYLKERKRTRGADIPSYGEAEKEDKLKKSPQKSPEKKKKEKKRKIDDVDSEADDDDMGPPPIKTLVSSPSSSQQPAPVTDEFSETMMKTIDEQLEDLVEEIWTSDEISESQKQSMKDKLTIKLKNNQFLKESDYEIVFEKIHNLIRTKNPTLSLITAFNITASHIIPHVLITCYSICKNLDYDDVKEIYHQQNSRVLGLDPSMSIPVTDHLEELCRLACDESDAIRK